MHYFESKKKLLYKIEEVSLWLKHRLIKYLLMDEYKNEPICPCIFYEKI